MSTDRERDAFDDGYRWGFETAIEAHDPMLQMASRLVGFLNATGDTELQRVGEVIDGQTIEVCQEIARLREPSDQIWQLRQLERT